MVRAPIDAPAPIATNGPIDTSGAERRVRRHGARGIDALRRRRRVGQQADRVRERQVRMLREQKRGGGPRRAARHGLR